MSGGLSAADEKRLGDLAIKIYEHFLALFVGTYSAAPYRIGFTQFHPERLLSFLPHELDFTHLRLLWREWKEKAQLSLCGHALTPYGPRGLDRMVANCLTFAAIAFRRRLLTYPWPGWRRAGVGAGRNFGKHSTAVIGAGRTRYRSISACRFICRCDCGRSSATATPASRRAITAVSQLRSRHGAGR